MITIFIPVYNEEKSIMKIIEKVSKLTFEKEILVVDDGSNDDSFKILQRLQNYKNFRLIKHKKNMGKGVAIRTGFRFAKGDYFIIQDADFEYEPDDLENVVKLIKNKNLSALVENKERLWAIGYRDLSLRGNFRFFHNLFNHIITLLINVLFGGTLKDSYSGCKLLPVDFMRKVKLRSYRFEIEAEISIKLLKKKYKARQTCIKYKPRKIKEGKKIGMSDAIKAIFTIIREKFNF